MNKFFYRGTEKALGAIYSEKETVFRVWAPLANGVKLALYNEYDDIRRTEFAMTREDDNVFSITLEGDYAGRYYIYLVCNNGCFSEVPDPYSISGAPNSEKSAVVDLIRTNPEGFTEHIRPDLDYKKAVIYETSVRDLTMDPAVSFENRGKFIGLLEDKKLMNMTTSLSHIKELGATHVHLLPVFDFISVNELNPVQYNWGYDPEFYMNLEGSYVVDIFEPHARIREFKQLVQKIHELGMGVVIDVVYNHTFKSYDSIYNTLVPDYYYRLGHDGYFSNGSGVGNELDSEAPMVRRLIVDSLKYMVSELGVDGIRFDLMALTDIDTIKIVRDELRKINPDILIYGEPWGGGESMLPYEKMTLKGRQSGEEFALFNDDFRNALKGDNDGSEKGFVQGDLSKMGDVMTGVAGSIEFSEWHRGFALEPFESINYHTSHDNYILYDKLMASMGDEGEEEIKKVTKLLFGIQMMSFGVPFIHEGTEFMNSKQMVHNSYNAPDEINMIRWQDKSRNYDIYEYIRDLIGLREKLGVFSTYDAEKIRKHLVFINSREILAYTVDMEEGPYRRICIFHNADRHDRDIRINIGDSYRVLVHSGLVDYDGLPVELDSTERLTVTSRSTIIIGELA